VITHDDPIKGMGRRARSAFADPPGI